MDLKKFGQIVHQKREALGIPLAVLARKAQIGRTTLWIVERGENPKTAEPSRLSQDRLGRLAEALLLDDREKGHLFELAGYTAARKTPPPAAGVSATIGSGLGKLGNSTYDSPISVSSRRVVINLLGVMEKNLRAAAEAASEAREVLEAELSGEGD